LSVRMAADAAAGARSALADRFMHVNLNVTSMSRSLPFYEQLLGLREVARTDGAPFEGEQLQLPGMVSNDCVFLYDWRGPRSAASIELMEWITPRTAGQPYASARTPGIQSITFSTSDLEGWSSRAEAYGGAVRCEVAGSITLPGAPPALLLQDPDGVRVEIVHDADASGSRLTTRGVRITCQDLAESMDFYAAIGFELMADPELATVNPETMASAMTGAPVALARLRLPADDPSLVVTLCEFLDASEHADGSQENVYGVANHVGLFRMALRVDDSSVAKGIALASGIGVRGPFDVTLTGTSIETMPIAFMTDPNGVVVEFVQRDRSLFRPARIASPGSES
jgi:catechol 2,3-dioxygenase-like lactoylglutathione lyase family enzyme